MATQLTPRRFSEDDIPKLEQFTCGDNDFGRVATEWIKCTTATDCAIQAMRDRGTEVYLYFEPESDALVGFGSVGTTERTVKGVRENWSIIPHVGIAKEFQGKPERSDWRDRYSTTVMVHLMGRASTFGTQFLTLFVHVDNKAAQKLYERLGFEKLGNPIAATGYQKMVIALRS